MGVIFTSTPGPKALCVTWSPAAKAGAVFGAAAQLALVAFKFKLFERVCNTDKLREFSADSFFIKCI